MMKRRLRLATSAMKPSVRAVAYKYQLRASDVCGGRDGGGVSQYNE